PHVRVAVLEQRLRAVQISQGLAQLFIDFNDRLDLGVFPGIGAKLALAGNDFRVAKQRSQFLETVAEDIQLIWQSRFLCGGLSVEPSLRANSSCAMASASRRPSADSFFSCTLSACSNLLFTPRASCTSSSSALAPFSSIACALSSSS